MLRPIGSLKGTIAGQWNRDFSKPQTRRDNVRWTMRQNMRCNPKGKGNKAWKRVDAMNHAPGILVWPDYAMPTRSN